MSHERRVLYVLSAASGGASNSMVALLRRLPRERFLGYVAVPPASDPDQLRDLAATSAECRSVLMTWWNARTRVKLWKRPFMWAGATRRTAWHVRPVLTLARWIREWRVDLVHTATSQVIDGALAAWLTGVPHVWHIREDIGRHGTFRFWMPERLLARTFSRLSSVVIANSEFSAGIFRRHGIDTKLVVVHNGIDVSVFREGAGREVRGRLGVGPGHTLVGMVATPTAMMKRHDLFIDMAAILRDRFPDARFAVFGGLPSPGGWLHDDQWRYSQRMQELVRGRGLVDRFMWAGHCPDVPGMMDSIDILVHPFGRESFGRVVLEAMAARRPVVGVRSGGVAEIIVDGETGLLVEEGSVDSLARATARLIEDPILRKTLGAQGRQRAECHFSLVRHVSRVGEIYQRVLDGVRSE